jgi:hypothetical protein
MRRSRTDSAIQQRTQRLTVDDSVKAGVDGADGVVEGPSELAAAG